MSISLTNQQAIEDVTRIASELTDKLVTKVESIGHGGNSRIFRLSLGDQDYVMKFYFQHPSDLRDRLGTEFKSLKFLCNEGIHQTPQPLNAWPQQSCALYEYVEGSLIKDIKTQDIDTAADFLKTLKGLNTLALPQEFVPASEAYFCAKEIVAGVRGRLKRFGFHEGIAEYDALKDYLDKDFNPLLDEVEQWSKKKFNSVGISWEEQLAPRYRTLSPSDFGFHNALKRLDGRICFLDFEYFGWDDPVKMSSDFLWHPAMNLSDALKQQFALRMQDLFSDDSNFQARFEALFPIFGLKWCLIFLNEFIASDAKRRDFARAATKDKATIRREQLDKAKHMSAIIKKGYRNFPYGN